MQYLLFTLLLVFIENASAQKAALTTTKLPMRNGCIYEVEHGISGCIPTKSEGVFVIGSSDRCFATMDGVVNSIFNLGDGYWAILVQDTALQFHVYANLSQPNFKKNSVVKQGDFIGSVLYNEMNEHELTYIISDRKGNSLPRQNTLKFLETINLQPTCSEQAL